MFLDRIQFNRDLDNWHESHLEYYENYVNSINKKPIEGLDSLTSAMSEIYPNVWLQIKDAMCNPSNDMSSTIERLKKSSFTENIIEQFKNGDDNSAAALYFHMRGKGLIIMFINTYNLWHSKILAILTLGLSRLLLSRMCKKMVEASLTAGYDTVEDWRETINVYYEGQKNSPDIEKYLMPYVVPNELREKEIHSLSIDEEKTKSIEQQNKDLPYKESNDVVIKELNINISLNTQLQDTSEETTTENPMQPSDENALSKDEKEDAVLEEQNTCPTPERPSQGCSDEMTTASPMQSSDENALSKDERENVVLEGPNTISNIETPQDDTDEMTSKNPIQLSTPKLKLRKERTFSDFIDYDDDIKDQIVNKIKKKLIADPRGESVTAMKLALERLKKTPKGKLEPFHIALSKEVDICCYVQVNKFYQPNIEIFKKRMELNLSVES